jgi:hypothetical protein
MKSPRPRGLIFAISLLIFHTPYLAAEAPSLPGAPPLRPAGSPPIPPTKAPSSLPTPPPAASGSGAGPMSTAAPSPTPRANRPPPFEVPPPYPEIVLPPQPTENASFTRGVPNLRDLQMAVPKIEVWRAQSDSPQMPARRHRRFELAYLLGKEPALVRLRFHPLAAGQAVVVQPGPGVTVNPPDTEFRVGPAGECVVSVALDRDFLRSDINIYCVGVKTKVPLSRASREIVEAKEAEGRGRR